MKSDKLLKNVLFFPGRFRTRWWAVWLFFFLVVVSVDASEKFFLKSGEEKIVRVKNLKGMSNPGDVVEGVVLEDGESVMIRAISWGETQVTLWDESGGKFHYVIEVEMPQFVRELKTYLQEIEGVNVSFLGRNIIVEGQVLRESDVPKLQGILRNFTEVKNMVNVAVPEAKKVFANAVKAELWDPGDLRFSPMGEGIMIEGGVWSEEVMNKAGTIASSYFDPVYPALKVLNVKLSLNVSFVDLVLNGSGGGSVGRFLNAFSKSDSGKACYTFFDSKNHESAMDEISGAGMAKILKNDVFTGQDSIVWKLGDDSFSFGFTLKPVFVDSGWVRCVLAMDLTKNGSNLFHKSEEFVLRNNQSFLLPGIVSYIKQYASEDVQKEILSLPVFSRSGAFSKESFLLLVLTPSWKVES